MHEVITKAGRTVNFVISGLHNPQVYGDGTQPGDVNAPLDDPYDGNVHFPNQGTYLVICGVQGHFVNDGMFGFVTVLP